MVELLVFIFKETHQKGLIINTSPVVQKIREWVEAFLNLEQDFLGPPGRGAGVVL